MNDKSLTLLLALTASASGRVVRRLTDGAKPTGPVAPDTVKDCTYWVNSASGDTCKDITDLYGLSQADFSTWNPSLGSDCHGFKAGNSYCIEENYGEGPKTTSPGPITTPSSTASQPPTSNTSPTTSPTNGAPSPVQSGIASNCQKYYLVKDGDGCQGIVDAYGTFTLQDFYSWNPAVGNTCTGLIAGDYVCVGIPGTPTTRLSTSTASPTGVYPTQSGIVGSCTKYYLAKPDDSCQGIVDMYGTFTYNDFVQWNPAVGSDCRHLIAGDYYCVAVPGTPTTRPTTTPGPSPTQSGITKSCTKFYQAVSGDDCGKIVAKFGTFTSSQFISWNPAVKQDCTGMIAGDYYCIAVPGTPTTRLPTSTTTAGGAPGETQPGISKNCNRYAQAIKDDTCPKFADRNRITQQNLFAWNTVLGSKGENCQTKFWANEYYCIGVKA